jgi:hypothetical protein
MINWIPVTSSTISRVRYDERTLTLEIEFIGGRVYQYFDVPPQIYQSFISADSKGRFLHSQLKGHFRYVRV